MIDGGGSVRSRLVQFGIGCRDLTERVRARCRHGPYMERGRRCVAMLHSEWTAPTRGYLSSEAHRERLDGALSLL